MPALRYVALAALAFVALAAVADRLFIASLGTPQRLDGNFSQAYLARELATLRERPPQTVVLGDSVLWGYELAPRQTAVARLAERGDPIVNLAYEGGSPVNTYAMAVALLAAGVRPACVVFNVNQKVFNASDSAYATIAPPVLALAGDGIAPDDRALLARREPPATLESRLDGGVAAVWQLYAMRADLREWLFGDVDAAHALAAAVRRTTGAAARTRAAHRPTAAAFEGTYDLAPLDAGNVSVHFLERTAELLSRKHIPAIAILTPANHALLHAYIDTPAYERNLSYVRELLLRRGVRVVDLDRAFAPPEFIDNDHLTAPANARLATLLAPLVARR